MKKRLGNNGQKDKSVFRKLMIWIIFRW
jgi:hypothetical protein